MLKNENSYEEFIFSQELWFLSVQKNPLYLGIPENSEGYNFSTYISIAKHLNVIGRQIEEQNKHEIYAVVRAYNNSKDKKNYCKYLIRKAEVFESDNVYPEYPKDCKFTFKDKYIRGEENVFFDNEVNALTQIDTNLNLIQKPKKPYNMDMNCVLKTMVLNFSYEYSHWEASWFIYKPPARFSLIADSANRLINQIDLLINS